MNSLPDPETNGSRENASRFSRLGVFVLAALVAVGLLALGGLTVSASTPSSARALQADPTPTPGANPFVREGGGSGVIITDLALPDSPFTLHWFAPNSDPSRVVAWGDMDNDGDLDLAVANYGKPNRVYINNNGVLDTDPGNVWQSDAPAEQGDLTTSLAWGDVNGDGWLDLVVGNERDCVVTRRSIVCNGGANRLYRNQQGTLSARSRLVFSRTGRQPKCRPGRHRRRWPA